jgi:gas vesicle protein
MTQQRTYYSEEARQRAELRTTMLVAFCLAIGAGIGTALALLFAPQRGEKTREDLFNSIEEQTERGRKASEKAIAGLEHQVNELKKRIEEGK